MFKQILEPLNALGTNEFLPLQEIASDITKYQSSCWFIYENSGSDLSSRFLKDAFYDVQKNLEEANDFYLAAGIITNFKAVGYQFSNQVSPSNKLYCYFVIQDFQQVRNTPIIY